jgi:hypothetical protein
MPFKSQAQRRWMYANHPEMAKEWSEHTPKGAKLPEHVKHKKADMSTEQAYIKGFMKRAAEHGLSDEQASVLLKESAEMPEALKKALMKILKNKKVQGDMKNRLAAGAIGGGYLGLVGGNVKANKKDEKGKYVSKNRALDQLKGILIGGGLGMAAGGTTGLMRKRKVLEKYMQERLAPRFEELAKKEPNAPLNRLSNLIQAETKHSTPDLQSFMDKDKFRFLEGPRLEGDDWRDSE